LKLLEAYSYLEALVSFLKAYLYVLGTPGKFVFFLYGVKEGAATILFTALCAYKFE
jgi:hypothetical protein